MITEREKEFLEACSDGDLKKAKELIKDGVNIDAKDEDGNTALILASENGHKDIVQMLLDARADVNARDQWGNTALILASENGHKDIVQMLLDARADVNARDQWGNTALMLASEKGHKDTVKLLKSREDSQKVTYNICDSYDPNTDYVIEISEAFIKDDCKPILYHSYDTNPDNFVEVPDDQQVVLYENGMIKVRYLGSRPHIDFRCQKLKFNNNK